MIDTIEAHEHQIDPATLVQDVKWVPEPPRESVRG